MHKILIVDDERPARVLLAKLVGLYMPDSKVIQGENALRAIEIMQTENIDLLFVDISMPVMNGLEMLEEIYRTGKKPYTFIITAYQKYEYAIKGLRLGIIDYIEKPLHKEKIYDAIKLYLNKVESDSIDLKVYDGIRRVRIDHLLAVEAIGRGKVKVFTHEFIFPEVISSLAQLYARLPSNFIYIRRDCVINLHEVKHYNLKANIREIFITYQNKEYPFVVSRENMKILSTWLNSEKLEI